MIGQSNAFLRVSSSHATTDVIKTDAPLEAIWDILRVHLKEKTKGNLALGKLDENHPKVRILNGKQGDTKVDFTITDDKGFNMLKSCVRYV